MADDVVIKITGDDSDAQRALNRTRDNLKKLGDRARQVGFALTGMGTAIAGVGFVGVKTFADFERTMARVGAVSNATAGQMDDLNEAARRMGRTTVFTATESAEALAFMAQAGLDAKNSAEALPSVLQLAAAGQIDLASSADLVTNVMAGMQLQIEDLGRANDVLVTGFTNANTDLTQLGQAFKFAGPVAAAAGLTFEEVTAALSLMGNAGIQGAMAGTGLRGSMTRLLNPTKEAAAVMERMGFNALDASGNLMPLNQIIGQLEETGLEAGDAMEIFGQRAGPAMLALVSQGSAALVDLTSKMEDSGGTAKRIADTQLETFKGQMDLLKSAVTDVAIVLGETLAPVLLNIADKLKGAAEAMSSFANEHPGLTQAIIVSTAGLAGFALVIGPILIVLPQLITGVQLLRVALLGLGGIGSGPVGLAIFGIAALATAFFALRGKSDEVSKTAMPAARESAIDLTNAAGDLDSATKDLAKTYTDELIPVLKTEVPAAAGATIKSLGMIQREFAARRVAFSGWDFSLNLDDINKSAEELGGLMRSDFTGAINKSGDAADDAATRFNAWADSLQDVHDQAANARVQIVRNLIDLAKGIPDPASRFGQVPAAGRFGIPVVQTTNEFFDLSTSAGRAALVFRDLQEAAAERAMPDFSEQIRQIADDGLPGLGQALQNAIDMTLAAVEAENAHKAALDAAREAFEAKQRAILEQPVTSGAVAPVFSREGLEEALQIQLKEGIITEAQAQAARGVRLDPPTPEEIQQGVKQFQPALNETLAGGQTTVIVTIDSKQVSSTIAQDTDSRTRMAT